MMFFLKPKQPKTLKHALLRGLIRAILSGVVFIAAFLLYTPPTTITFENLAPDPVEDRAALIMAEADRLHAKGDCWRDGEKFTVEVPSRVVYSPDSRSLPRFGGPKKVDQALHQIFEGERHGLYVFSFCP